MKIYLTLEQKVGQMFFVRCPGPEAAKEHLAKYKPGGFLLFGVDFEHSNPELMKETLATYKKDSEIPLFIGSDEEGGSVTRASSYKQFRAERFKSPRELYAIGGERAIVDDAVMKSEFLAELGINVNFAPVCDMSSTEGTFISGRVLGLPAKETAEIISSTVRAMKSCGMGSVLKHFPGYGDNADTHIGVAVDDRSLDELRKNDFLPFVSGIEAGADSVMMSHNILSSVDERYPTSLSEKMHALLRQEVGFDRVIITDDLMMDAIRLFCDGEAAAVRAVLSGNDMLCASDYEIQIPAVVNAVKKGIIDESVIDKAVDKIFAWKRSLGIIG